MNNYIIGSGFHRKSERDDLMLAIWKENTEKYSKDYFIISTTTPTGFNGCILVNNNLGHIGDLINNNKDGLCGWSASILALALLAYNAGKDYVYKESDALWFGGVPDQMYQDCEGKQFVFGGKMRSAPFMSCAQSTFLIKHSFLLTFVSAYLRLPDDRLMIPENKFEEIEKMYRNEVGRLSFGVDRERPIPWENHVWYCQQWTDEELAEAKARNLI